MRGKDGERERERVKKAKWSSRVCAIKQDQNACVTGRGIYSEAAEKPGESSIELEGWFFDNSKATKGIGDARTVTLSGWKRAREMTENNNGVALAMVLVLAFYLSATNCASTRHMITKRNYSDQSVRGYLAERTCWWNEVCKEEFHSKFRCRCPRWSYCRAPGRYYDAHCSMTRTGYIWTQPETSMSLEANK